MISYLSMKSVDFAGDISVMKHAMGVMQHHDAVTGTSKQFVIDDYIRILHRGFEESLKIHNSFYQYCFYAMKQSLVFFMIMIDFWMIEKSYQSCIRHEWLKSCTAIWI